MRCLLLAAVTAIGLVAPPVRAQDLEGKFLVGPVGCKANTVQLTLIHHSENSRSMNG